MLKKWGFLFWFGFFFRKLFQAFHHSQSPFANEKVGSCFVTYSLNFIGISCHLSRCCGKDVGSFWLPLSPRPFLKVAFVVKLSRCNGQYLLKRQSQSLPSLFLSLKHLDLCSCFCADTGSCLKPLGAASGTQESRKPPRTPPPRSVWNLNWLECRVGDWHCKQHWWWEVEEQGCPFR